MASLIRSIISAQILNTSTTFTPIQSLDPMFWWTRFASASSLTSELQDNLGDEIQSSFIWQRILISSASTQPVS
jgi:hypothetical protein